MSGPIANEPVLIVIDGFAQPQKAPQGVIMPPLPKPMRSRHHIQMYSPTEVRKWQSHAKSEASRQMAGRIPLSGPLQVEITIYLPITQSMPRKRRELAEHELLFSDKRPDCSNYAKAIEDSLNGIAYLDDGQIGQLIVNKIYSPKPRVEIRVKSIEVSERITSATQSPLFAAKKMEII